jgi:predicted nuclease of predicted toxin-antitoxin system
VKFKLDENIPPSLSKPFLAAGHDAHSVLEQSLGGQPDTAVIDACKRESRALVTLDLDFANIRTYPPAEYSGIVVLRLTTQAYASVEAAINRVVELLPNESLAGTLWIVEDRRVRVHE